MIAAIYARKSTDQTMGREEEDKKWQRTNSTLRSPRRRRR
jgi:hypothetical protein